MISFTPAKDQPFLRFEKENLGLFLTHCEGNGCKVSVKDTKTGSSAESDFFIQYKKELRFFPDSASFVFFSDPEQGADMLHAEKIKLADGVNAVALNLDCSNGDCHRLEIFVQGPTKGVSLGWTDKESTSWDRQFSVTAIPAGKGFAEFKVDYLEPKKDQPKSRVFSWDAAAKKLAVKEAR